MRRPGVFSRLLLLVPLLAVLAGATAAQDDVPADAAPLSGDEFEALTTGRTLTYGIGGEPYGIERYMPGRRVIWAFLGAECREGRWFEDEGKICFVYDAAPGELHCWRFYEAGRTLLARIADAGAGSDGGETVKVEDSTAPMHCPGPRIGV